MVLRRVAVEGHFEHLAVGVVRKLGRGNLLTPALEGIADFSDKRSFFTNNALRLIESERRDSSHHRGDDVAFLTIGHLADCLMCSHELFLLFYLFENVSFCCWAWPRWFRQSFKKVFKRKSIYNIFFRAPTAPGLGDAVFKIMKLADGVSVGIYDHFHSGFARHFYVFVFKVNPPGMSVNLQNRPRALGGFDYRFHIHLVGLPAVYNPARRVKQNIQMRIFHRLYNALRLLRLG